MDNARLQQDVGATKSENTRLFQRMARLVVSVNSAERDEAVAARDDHGLFLSKDCRLLGRRYFL